MSDEASRRKKKSLIWAGAFLTLALALLLVPLLGLHGTRLPPTARQVRQTAPATDAPFEDALEALHKEPNPAAYRNVIARLNGIQSLTAERLPDSERRLVREDFHLDDGELAEVNSPKFTALDAYYLDQCFLLHDAARSLGVDDRSPEERAGAGFQWVVRQVRLEEVDGPASPPLFVLRRGWGTARERSLVFLALLEQLGLHGCMIVLPQGQAPRDWVPGALADGQIYLFDTRLGLPLPGSATFATVKNETDWLKPLSPAPDLPYDVDFPQARQAQLQVACSLSALAPRMRRLQTRLEATNGPRLAADPAALMEEFRNALQKSGLSEPVRVWGSSSAGDDALRALRSFLSPTEGGSDRPKSGTLRRARFNESLTPWKLLPSPVERLPEGSDLGPRLRQGFAKPFLDLAYDPRMPHELMLRGRLDEAVAGFVEIRGTIERLRENVENEANPGRVLETWIEEVRRAYAEWLRAQREADGKNTPALQAAQLRMNQLWEPKQAQKPIEILQAAAALPRVVQVTYFLALAKQEMAERAQVMWAREGKKPQSELEELNQLWQTSADWWQKFLNDFPTDPAAASARLHLARALTAQGNRTAAVQLLQEPPAYFRPWEKRACKVRPHVPYGVGN